MGSTGLGPTFIVGTSHTIAVAAMTPLIPLYAAAAGASAAAVGIIVGSSAALPLLLGVWAGAGTDTLGPRRMVQIAALIHAGSAAMIAAAHSLPLIAAGAALAGLATNMMVIACQTSVGHLSPPSDRDRHYGVFAFWMSLGQLLGPLIGGFLADSYSLRVAFYACAAIATTPLLFALRLARPPRRSTGHTPHGLLRARDVYRSAWALTQRPDLRFILWISFLIIVGWSIKTSFLPLYLQSAGLPKSQIGLIYSFMGVGAMIIRPLLGWLAGRFGRRRVLLGAVMLGTVTVGGIPLLTRFWPLAVVAGASGIAWGVTQPLTMSLMAGAVDLRERGLALSLRISSNRLGEVVSPIVFGVLVMWTGISGAFLAAAAALVGSIAVIGRPGRRGTFQR
jgi:MFS family permease